MLPTTIASVTTTAITPSSSCSSDSNNSGGESHHHNTDYAADASLTTDFSQLSIATASHAQASRELSAWRAPRPDPATACERGGRACAPADAGYENENDPVGSSCEESKETSHVIPGVEHVFFEDELLQLERMEQEKNIILLAVDDGCHSEMAFKFYLDNVDRPGYTLHVVHHSDVWSHYKHSDEGPSADQYKEIAEKAKGVVDRTEEKYKKMMEDHKIQGEFITLHGKDAWHDIIQYQEKSNAMMIVMGTRGSGAISRTFRGSVSDSVVHHAHVPVLVCCHPKD